MSSTTQRATDAVNPKKNVGENPLKRTYAKLRHPFRAQVSDSAAEKAQSDEPGGEHVATAEYTAASVHTAVKELCKYLRDDEGQDALRKIFMLLGNGGYNFAMQMLMSDELKAASRMAGREIVSGSSEGIESTLSSQWDHLPKFVTVSILPVIAVFGGLFMLGLLLSLWRFALFGLHN